MASNIPGAGFEIAYSNGFLFTNAKTDDFMIHTTLPDQRFLLGTASNGLGVLLLTSNAVAVNKASDPEYTLDVDGDIHMTGKLYQNNALLIMSRWSSNNTLSNIFRTEGRVTIGSNVFPELFNVYNGNAYFDSNAYVMSQLGIGTSNPSSNNAITVVGNAAISSNLAVEGNLQINKSFQMNGLYIKRDPNAVSATATISATVTNVNTVGRSMYLSMQGDTSNEAFYFISGSNQRQLMLLRGDGNMGIGTSNPTYRLTVAGDIYATGNITQQSDSNYKTDLHPIQNALHKVHQLQGYTYLPFDPHSEAMDTDLASPRPRYAGLLAQDVEKVLPEVVMRTPDNRLSLAYGNLVALLVEAIKEQQTTVQQLTQANQSLEQRVQALEQQMRR